MGSKISVPSVKQAKASRAGSLLAWKKNSEEMTKGVCTQPVSGSAARGARGAWSLALCSCTRGPLRAGTSGELLGVLQSSSAKGFGCEMPKCSRCLRASGRCAGLGGSRRGAGRRYFVRGKFIRAVIIPAQLHVLLLCLVLLLTLVHDSSRQSQCFPRAAWCLHLLLLSNLFF